MLIPGANEKIFIYVKITFGYIKMRQANSLPSFFFHIGFANVKFAKYRGLSFCKLIPFEIDENLDIFCGVNCN